MRKLIIICGTLHTECLFVSFNIMASKKRGASNSLSLESASPRTRSQTKKALHATMFAEPPQTVEVPIPVISPPPPIVEQSDMTRPHVDVHPASPALMPAKKPSKPPANRSVKGKKNVQALAAKEIRQEAHQEGLQVSKAVVELLAAHFRHVTDRDVEMIVLRTAIRAVQKSHKKRILVRHVEPLVELAIEVRQHA